MALKLIAVEGMTIIPSDPNVIATITITGLPSIKAKAEGNGVYKNGLEISVSAITYPTAGATIPDPGPYTAIFTATAQKVKADGELVLRIDDETGIINAVPQIPPTPPNVDPIDFPIAFTVKISVPGQLKVKGQ